MTTEVQAAWQEAAGEESEAIRSRRTSKEVGYRPCENACGWTAYQDRPTCCRNCRGPSGPHASDCAKKNIRLSLKKRLQLLSKDEQRREALQQEQAIEEIKKAQSGPELIELLSTLIEDEWLHDLDSIEGNIYRSVAFGIVRLPMCAEIKGLLMQPWSSGGQSQFLGSVCVWLIQISSPLVLQHYYLNDGYNMHISLSGIDGQKLMGALFLLIFCLNARFEVTREAANWERVNSLWQFLDVAGMRQTHGWALLLGPITKCWVYISTCWCTMMMLGTSEEPKDILFDALALFFLYNLDRLGGALAFLSEEKWPGKQFAFLHQWLLREEQLPEPDRGKFLFRATSMILGLMNVILPILYLVAVWENEEEEEG